MYIQTIKTQLQETHNSFISYLETLTAQEFQSAKNDKWTAAQQLEHIYLSVQPVRLVFSFPKFLLKLKFFKNVLTEILKN